MTPRNTAPDVPETLPSDLIEWLDSLEPPVLQDVLNYAEQRLADNRTPLPQQIRSEAAGKIVDIKGCEAYTLVRKYPPAESDSKKASQPLLLYRVKREKRLDGEETLHWSYLGEVCDPPCVHCENCGTLVEEWADTCPQCGEEIVRFDEEV